MNKDVICINNGILVSHKKNEIMPFVAIWIDLEIIILREVSQTKKHKYHMKCHLYVESEQTIQMSLCIKQK